LLEELKKLLAQQEQGAQGGQGSQDGQGGQGGGQGSGQIQAVSPQSQTPVSF
jgi:hypothetical protein